MRIKDDSKIKNILKIVSPGTNLREGLENILRAKTGGLIVLSDNEEVMKLVDGGFYINSEYSPFSSHRKFPDSYVCRKTLHNPRILRNSPSSCGSFSLYVHFSVSL